MRVRRVAAEATTAATPTGTRTHGSGRPFTIPRGLVMLAAAWTFASWIGLFGFAPPVQAQASSYGPSITLLFTSIGVGLGIGWPLLRLTQARSAAPVRQSLADLVALVFLFQVVAWPLRLVTAWSMERTLAVVAAFAIGASTVAALLAIAGRLATGRMRATAMLVLVATSAAAPLASLGPGSRAGAGGGPASASDPRTVLSRRSTEALVALSPPTLLARFSAPEPLGLSDADRSLLEASAAVSAGLWTVAGLAALASRRGAARGADDETV
ncbi:MAG: hypothetical protein RI967_486 [Planctomycetota bacterium]